MQVEIFDTGVLVTTKSCKRLLSSNDGRASMYDSYRHLH